MPTTKTTAPAKSPGAFAERMLAAREAAGLIRDQASVYARDMLGAEFWGISRETIRRLENGSIPEDQADPIIVAALADIYGADINKLSPSVAQKLENVRLMATRVLAGTGGRRVPARRRPNPNTWWSSDASTAKVSASRNGRRARAVA